MTTTSRSTLLLALTALSASNACAGGQTGEEEHGMCALTAVELAPDQSSSLGFTPGELLQLAQGSHVVSFEWLPVSGRSYGPESGPSELELSITSRGTARELAPSDSMSGCCTPSLRVDVRVALQTSGGALDESFDAALFGTAPGEVTLFHHLLAQQIDGDFTFAELGDGQQLELLQLTARFAPGQLGGTLSAGIESVGSSQNADGNASFGLWPLAEWGEPAAIRSWCSNGPP